MILTVNYDKVTGNIVLTSDVSSITAEVNYNSINDNSNTLDFEVAIDTSVYEQINELPE